MPFSDPVADGPVIQRASERALKRGTSLAQVLTLAAEIRQQAQSTGLIVFTYLNPILRDGHGEVLELRAAGVDGVLVTDLPVEEAGEYLRAMREYALVSVLLAAPTSPDERLRRIAEHHADSFMPYRGPVSRGQRQQLAEDARKLVKRLRRVTKSPIALGFGISSAEQFAEVGQFADAVVVGSAIVQTVEKNRGQEAKAVGDFVRGLLGRVPVGAGERTPSAMRRWAGKSGSHGYRRLAKENRRAGPELVALLRTRARRLRSASSSAIRRCRFTSPIARRSSFRNSAH